MSTYTNCQLTGHSLPPPIHHEGEGGCAEKSVGDGPSVAKKCWRWTFSCSGFCCCCSSCSSCCWCLPRCRWGKREVDSGRCTRFRAERALTHTHTHFIPPLTYTHSFSLSQDRRRCMYTFFFFLSLRCTQTHKKTGEGGGLLEKSFRETGMSYKSVFYWRIIDIFPTLIIQHSDEQFTVLNKKLHC